MTTDQRIARGVTLSWLIGLCLLSLVVASRIGVFALTAPVSTADGIVTMPNALASVDHPFHIARAETLRQSLAGGELPRWIANHQGGYPVEFYPLGVAWIEVGLWAAALGALAMPEVHTIAVTLLFLSPLGAFAILARQDHRPVRLVALAILLHVLVPGDWWHGGYTELVQWGLVTNVAGAVAALYLLALLSRYVATGAAWAGVGAIAASAVAVYTNPRSLAALVVAGLAVWLTALLRHRDRHTLRIAPARLALVGLGGALLAAPQLSALIRFGDLYAFVRYEQYANFGEYLASSAGAVSALGLGCAVLGALWGFSNRQWVAASTVGVAFILYAGLTAFLMLAPDAVNQLEATRLMPFQRLVMVYLAATFIERVIDGVVRRATVPTVRVGVEAGLLVAAILVFAARLAPVSLSPTPALTDPMSPTLYAVDRAAVPQQADFAAAVRAADAAAPPGTALLVIGSALSWHQQLWAPLWTDRQLIYDDWLWGWNRNAAGTPGYRWEAGNHFPDPAATLDRAFLARHGIGGVVVTGPVAPTAARTTWLSSLRGGTYQAYLVADPTPLVTIDDAWPESLMVAPQRTLAVAATNGAAVVARWNWFPRWSAGINGEPATVELSRDGLTVAANGPNAPASIEFTYATTAVDWMARGLAVAGVGVAGAIVGIARRRTPLRSAREPSSATPP